MTVAETSQASPGHSKNMSPLKDFFTRYIRSWTNLAPRTEWGTHLRHLPSLICQWHVSMNFERKSTIRIVFIERLVFHFASHFCTSDTSLDLSSDFIASEISGMDPQGPSQPSLDTVYNTAGNPADQNPQEQRNATVNANTNAASLVDAREQGDVPVPSSHNEGATSTSLGYGARDASGDKADEVCPEKDLLNFIPVAYISHALVANQSDN